MHDRIAIPAQSAAPLLMRIGAALTVWCVASPLDAQVQLEDQVRPITISSPRGVLADREPPSRIEAIFDSEHLRVQFQAPGQVSAQMERITNIPAPIHSDVPYSFEVKRKADGEVELENPRLQFLVAWEQDKHLLADNAKFSELAKVVERIPDNSLTIPREYRQELELQLSEAIVQSQNAEEMGPLIESYYLQEKSYGGDQQIPFSVFRAATTTCLATCAIQQVGRPKPHGSGILVGKNLVFTCKHNFKGIPGGPTACHVRFNYTEKDGGTYFKIARVLHQSPSLDFCALVLGDEVGAANDRAFALPTPPLLGPLPELRRNEGLYVAGHPRGEPLAVALNASVTYPHFVEDQLGVMALAKLAELRLFTSREEYEDGIASVAPRIRQFFDESYRRESSSNAFYFHPFGVPAIGANPDTKAGDSGAAVFDISRNCVIGLLKGGKPDDVALPDGPTYLFFELVLPISRIVQELDVNEPNWKSDFQVTYFGDPT